MFTLYKVYSEATTTLKFSSVEEVEAFLNSVYDDTCCELFSDAVLYHCYTTAMSQWKRCYWVLSMLDSSNTKIPVVMWKEHLGD